MLVSSGCVRDQNMYAYVRMTTEKLMKYKLAMALSRARSYVWLKNEEGAEKWLQDPADLRVVG